MRSINYHLFYCILIFNCTTSQRPCETSNSVSTTIDYQEFWELSLQNKWDDKIPKILNFTRDHVKEIYSSTNCFLFKLTVEPTDTIEYVGIELYDKRKIIRTRGIDKKIYKRYNHIETLYFNPESREYEFTFTVADTKKEERKFDRELKKHFKNQKTAPNNG